MEKTEAHGTFLARFGLLRFQFVLLAVAIAVYLLHRALHSSVLMTSTLINTFVAGNVTILLILWTRPLFEHRLRPWNWVAYIAVLIGVAIVANTALLPSYLHFAPAGFSWKHIVLRDSPLTLMITFIVGLLLFLFDDSRAQLKAQHMELQRRLQSHVQVGLSERWALQSDLDQAHEIQMHLLPRETPQLAGFQIACAWQAARSVSGDYFDVLSLSEGRLGLCIADVSGKGVAAALLMANLQASVRAFAREGVTPSALCSQLNSVLCDNIAPGRFVTLFYAVLDQQSRALRYESAGHCLPLLVHANGAIEIPEASSGVLGLFSHWTFSDHSLQLASGDVLVVMTDGVLEAWNTEEEEFGYKRLIESVLASRKDGAHGIRRRVLGDVTAFCKGQFVDDASLIVVTVD
jgi:sigma-B regulation protein RsbU (phosphoserine phosphatase)